jgi:hypothetical protein
MAFGSWLASLLAFAYFLEEFVGPFFSRIFLAFV